jgi:ubiquinone/menaquinone biosynthesis C-methylase UbiE
MEVESAALTVHAPIFVPKGELSINGDFELRDNFHKNMKKNFIEKDFKPKRILDIGSSTGLSTIKLHDSFPNAEIIGLDLSPYMLSVAKHQLQYNPKYVSAKSSISYIHGAGESSSLGKNDVDLITMCLVSHELPIQASRDIFSHAYDILPDGGAFALMDINPKSEFFIKFAANAFAFSAFKSTEPWISEYISMDLEATLKDIGFRQISVVPNSLRHRTVIAYK